MTKLHDTQTILLSTASQRDGRSLYPLSDALSTGEAHVAKALAGLLKGQLLAEREHPTLLVFTGPMATFAMACLDAVSLMRIRFSTMQSSL